MQIAWKISGRYALLVINGKLSLTDKCSAGCAERRKSGSVRRVDKHAAFWENQNGLQPMQRAVAPTLPQECAVGETLL